MTILILCAAIAGSNDHTDIVCSHSFVFPGGGLYTVMY
jgi:hypothetical protein